MEFVRIKQATKTGSTPCIIGGVADLNYVSSKTRRGRVQGMGNISPTITALDNGIHRIEKPCAIDEQNMLVRDETVGTLTTDGSSPKHNNRVMDTEYRIRKLTPLECYRLMGVEDSDALKMLNVNSNTQCYKQAGNSIVVDVMCAMFRNLNIQGVKTWNEHIREKDALTLERNLDPDANNHSSGAFYLDGTPVECNENNIPDKRRWESYTGVSAESYEELIEKG